MNQFSTSTVVPGARPRIPCYSPSCAWTKESNGRLLLYPPV